MTIPLVASAGFAGALEAGITVRGGLVTRTFEAASLELRGRTPAIGAELAYAAMKPRAAFGWRPSLGVEAWGQRWVQGSTPWNRELGIRLEPRLSARFVLGPGLWTRDWRLTTTVDVGVGAAAVLFVDDHGGAWALSPTVALRPAVHVGRFSPGFVALDLRLGMPVRPDGCAARSDLCPSIRLDPGGTSIGVLLGRVM